VIYDHGTECERAPVDDNHRPSAATLVDTVEIRLGTSRDNTTSIFAFG
jgi:hypothetical protein